MTWAVQEYLRLTSTRAHHDAKDPGDVDAVFKSVKVWGSGIGSTYQETVPNLILNPLGALIALFSSRQPQEKTILHGIDGVVQSGEMLLVLGRPGSGCTTLLKTLAGETDSFHGFSGDIRYSGVSVNEVKKGFRGDIVYNAESMV